MRSNIGPIVDFLLPYISQIQIRDYHGRPFMSASARNREMITKGTMYVLQTAPDQFAYIDAECTSTGFQFFPQDCASKPFVMEQDFIHQKFGGCMTDSSFYDSMIINASFGEIIHQIIDRLGFYDVIRYKTSSGPTVLESMDINSTRIRRAIEKAFKDAGRYTGSISDLIDIVCIEHTPFQLTGLKEKELECVQKRLKSVGIITTIDDDSIASIYFERK